jgi:hypothetical protein
MKMMKYHFHVLTVCLLMAIIFIIAMQCPAYGAVIIAFGFGLALIRGQLFVMLALLALVFAAGLTGPYTSNNGAEIFAFALAVIIVTPFFMVIKKNWGKEKNKMPSSC